MPDQDTIRGSGGNRLRWTELPTALRTAVESRLGARVVHASSQSGGFSPGMASRLALSDGRRIFVKAVSTDQNPDSPALYRREARVAKRLPIAVPAPKLLWSHDDGHWVVLAFEDVPGHPPALPWQPAERNRVLAALTELSTSLTPSPIPAPKVVDDLDTDFTGWRGLAAGSGFRLSEVDSWAREHLTELADQESRWALAAAGDTLLHCDVRADNVLLTHTKVVFVDWPSAALGAAWFDLLILLPSMSMQGGGDPERIVSTHPLTRHVDPEAITTVLTAVTGYFVNRSLLPAPPGLPRVRAFQRSQGEAALRWLRRRLDR